MRSWIFKKVEEFRNRKTAEIKVSVFIIIIAVCLLTYDCSTKPSKDLISMNKSDLEKLHRKTPVIPLKVDILNELAYRASWNGGAAPLNYVNFAKKLAKKLKYQRGLVDAFCISGLIYFLEGKFDKAKIRYLKGRILANKIGYRTGKAMGYAGIGRYYQVKGEFTNGLKNFLKGEDICKSSSNKSDKRVLAQAYYGLGALYYYGPEDYEEAMKHFKRLLSIGNQIKDDIIITSGYYAIGVQYHGMGKYKKAKSSFSKCFKRSKRIGLIYNKANAYEGFGDVYTDQGNYNKALESYMKSHEQFLKTGNKFQIAEIKMRLGKLYNKMGERDNNIKKYEKALKYLKEALSLARNLNAPKTIEKSCEELIKSHEKLECYKNASNYYQLLLKTKEFLRRNQMLSLKLKLDYEKEVEQGRIVKNFLIIGLIGLFIVLVVVLMNSLKLRKQKAKIEEQSEILTDHTLKLAEALEKEKEVSDHKDDLMHTLYHQYKTPVSIIDSSAQILKFYLPKLSAEEIEEHVAKILSNLEKMTHLIDQLLKFGKQFTPDYYDLYTICGDFTEEIGANEGNKHIIEFKPSGNCEKIKLDKDFLNIILSNLMINSIKYSPEGSKIILELLCDEEYAVIKVRDNGIGIPGDYLKIPFERFHRGSNVGSVSGTGLGLAIVKRYTDLHDAKISIESQLGTGTTVTIKLPRGS